MEETGLPTRQRVLSKRAPLTTSEGAAQKVRRRIGMKRPLSTTLEELDPAVIGLISITGPPWYDEATGKELDPAK
eukprot:4548708-Heterocapsa_arctica.AAC.1